VDDSVAPAMTVDIEPSLDAPTAPVVLESSDNSSSEDDDDDSSSSSEGGSVDNTGKGSKRAKVGPSVDGSSSVGKAGAVTSKKAKKVKV